MADVILISDDEDDCVSIPNQQISIDLDAETNNSNDLPGFPDSDFQNINENYQLSDDDFVSESQNSNQNNDYDFNFDYQLNNNKEDSEGFVYNFNNCNKNEKIDEKAAAKEKRLQKKLETAKKKGEKNLEKKRQESIKPENCLKRTTVILDDQLEEYDFFTNLKQLLTEAKIEFTNSNQLISNSITWKKKVEDYFLNDIYEVCVKKLDNIYENYIIVVWDSKETVNHVHYETLVTSVSSIIELTNKKLFLVIYGIEEYFKYQKRKKDNASQDQIKRTLGMEQKKSKNKKDKAFENLPEISRQELERLLADVQLNLNVNSRYMDCESDMVTFVHQFTKALASAPAKIKDREEMAKKLKWCAEADNKDCVAVDQYGNGLKRLWQQQLCQFNLVTLEIAEAITSFYKSPLQLMEEYARLSPSDGEMLLKDIQVRRGGGAISFSGKKIGPELSKKIYTLLTSRDGDVYLNE